jgi:hypothetical protein
VHLTQSKIRFLAFLNQDETILTIDSWSKNTMNECTIQDILSETAYGVKQFGNENQ